MSVEKQMEQKTSTMKRYVVTAPKSTVRLYSDPPTKDLSRPSITNIWEPFIKSLDRRVVAEGMDVFSGVEWQDGFDNKEHKQKVSKEQMKMFVDNLWDPTGVQDPNIK